MKKTIIFILALAVFLFSQSSYAVSYKVLAVVNGESVSTVQVRERAELIINSSGAEKTEANKKTITEEVSEILINEALERQEAKAKDIKVTAADISAAVADIEKRNNLKPNGFKDFLASKNVSYSAFIDQLTATLTWQKILGKYVRPGIEVTKEDIEHAKAEVKPVSTSKKVNLSEIIIPIEFGKEKEAEDFAGALVRTARSGEKSFADLAKTYSVGKTSKNKGEVGWVPEEGMMQPLAGVVKKTAVGKITDPIKAQSMYVILKVNDRQNISEAPPQTPEQIALMSKMEAGSKKYLKTLRNNAYIDKKYTPDQLMQLVWE